MSEVRELRADESHRAALALIELRPHLAAGELGARIDAQRSAGYRLVASFEPASVDAAAAGGFRVSESLAWGRFLYVDDLVTRAALRGRGHAAAIMAWLEEEAARQGCGQVHLDSGVGPDRADAHRFYFRRGLRIDSYHFSRSTPSA